MLASCHAAHNVLFSAGLVATNVLFCIHRTQNVRAAGPRVVHFSAFILLVVVVVLQFKSLYIKNRKRCVKFCTQVGSDDPTCSDLLKCL